MKETEIQKIVNRNKLFINRIPVETRKSFIARAENEFNGNYGLCLSFIMKEAEQLKLIREEFKYE